MVQWSYFFCTMHAFLPLFKVKKNARLICTYFCSNVQRQANIFQKVHCSPAVLGYIKLFSMHRAWPISNFMHFDFFLPQLTIFFKFQNDNHLWLGQKYSFYMKKSWVCRATKFSLSNVNRCFQVFLFLLKYPCIVLKFLVETPGFEAIKANASYAHSWTYSQDLQLWDRIIP